MPNLPRPNREKRDAQGRVTRTDHPTMMDVVKDVINRVTRGGTQTDKRTNDAVRDAISEMKERQDGIANITRRT